MPVELRPWQEEVLERLEPGKILWGGVGSGKSIVALKYIMDHEVGLDIVVITTAKKRDSLEWLSDAAKFGIGRTRDATVAGIITVDSWNNIAKYVDRKDTFFIFDEQRLVGNGAWVKSFLKIAKAGNPWLLLSATPGDTWLDYVPVFIANGYYKNVTQFKNEHVVYAPFSRYPRIDRFINVNTLERHKADVLVEMPYLSDATRHHEDVRVFYDVELFKKAEVERWHVYEDRPMRDKAEWWAVLRKIVWSDRSRLAAIRGLMDRHPKLIVFYNYNYELDILRELYDASADLVEIAEWNGHRKDPIPDSDNWVYLVQYTAGAEGWNCTETNAMVFYSLTYSYKQWEQAQGRIDRLNTYFRDLYYFSFMSNSIVDAAVRRTLERKEAFNERRWLDENVPDWGEFGGVSDG